MNRLLVLGAVAALTVGGGPAGLAPVGRAASDEPPGAVLDWSANASNAIVTVARQPPHAALLSFAMVQGAVYDAVNAIDGGYQPYLAAPAATGSESKSAAVAAAAHDVLVSLFPAQTATLDAQYAASLASIPDGTAETGGVAIGQAAAAAMIAARTNDGRFGPSIVVVGSNPGEWRPTPPALAQDPASWVGRVRPFLLPRGDLFRSDGPNALTSGAYAADFAEVKSLGSAASTTRTPDQTDAAIYWQDNGAALWNRIFRSMVATEELDLVDAARMFGMANLAAADGAISCWNDKYYWNFWRPITAIREAASDGNPATDADPTWAPLFATPAFPDHPSGHGCASGAIVHTLQAFFGTDKVAFSAFSYNSNTTRSFSRLSGALKEIIGARVWAGIHFRTADVQGAVIGRKVAHWLVRHWFEPAD
ncbi:MAG TPA: vanadium-dependent haloperoxidase [Candidatus Deferrimicrobium sp.]|nr:vanadium-dependent haloperoxidase [Candidatus Deferrimicrobium sp.]